MNKVFFNECNLYRNNKKDFKDSQKNPLGLSNEGQKVINEIQDLLYNNSKLLKNMFKTTSDGMLEYDDQEHFNQVQEKIKQDADNIVSNYISSNNTETNEYSRKSFFEKIIDFFKN